MEPFLSTDEFVTNLLFACIDRLCLCMSVGICYTEKLTRLRTFPKGSKYGKESKRRNMCGKGVASERTREKDVYSVRLKNDRSVTNMC